MTRLNKPVSRVTRFPFFTYGPDRDRPFVATLAPEDVLTLRPLRCRRESASVTIKLEDVYRYALRCRVNMTRLEQANVAKRLKAERRARRRLKAELKKESQ